MSVVPADTAHWSIPWSNETEMLDVTGPNFAIRVNTLLECPMSVKCPNRGIDIHHDAHWMLRRHYAGRLSKDELTRGQRYRRRHNCRASLQKEPPRMCKSDRKNGPKHHHSSGKHG